MPSTTTPMQTASGASPQTARGVVGTGLVRLAAAPPTGRARPTPRSGLSIAAFQVAHLATTARRISTAPVLPTALKSLPKSMDNNLAMAAAMLAASLWPMLGIRVDLMVPGPRTVMRRCCQIEAFVARPIAVVAAVLAPPTMPMSPASAEPPPPTIVWVLAQVRVAMRLSGLCLVK